MTDPQTETGTRVQTDSSSFRLLLVSMRPWEWIKNLLVLAPLFFSGYLTHPVMVQRSFWGFILFCLLASAIYLFNDITDRQTDILHPVKARRPLASGDLSPSLAFWTGISLSSISLVGGFLLSKVFVAVLGVYILLNILYSLWLKQVIILDVMAIAMGFVLRVVGGAAVVEVQPSNWIIMCTVLLSLFLALSKRRYEYQSLQGEPGQHRRVLKGYNPYILDQLIAVVTASTVMSYALYAITIGQFQIYSVFFVLYGIFRYLYVLHGGIHHGTPTEVLLGDRPLLITLLLWGGFLLIDIYFL